MKNVLFILPFLPYPLKSGGHQAIFNGIKAFVNDINISIVFEEEWDKDFSNEIEALKREIGRTVEIYRYKKPDPKKVHTSAFRIYAKIWQLKELVTVFFRKKQRSPVYDCAIQAKPQDYIRFLDDIIKKERIDIVQCEMLGTITNILTIPKNIRSIFVHHEIGFIRQQQEIDQNIFSANITDNKWNELFLLNRFDHIVTLSSQDKKILQASGVVSQIHTSFALVQKQPCIQDQKFIPYDLSFVGPSEHAPNKIGIHWFLENCWSKLQTINNNYNLKIIGEWSKTEQKTISSKYTNVKFMGFVDNLTNAISGSIMIVPVTIGSGIRMKIIDAANIGCPIVSTSIGCQGLPFSNQKDILIGDSPTEFIKQIVALKDDHLARTLTTNANTKIQTDFSTKKFYESRIALYQ